MQLEYAAMLYAAMFNIQSCISKLCNGLKNDISEFMARITRIGRDESRRSVRLNLALKADDQINSRHFRLSPTADAHAAQ